MQDARYQVHLKNLGKLAYEWGQASAQEPEQSQTLANFADQVADGSITMLPAVLAMQPFQTRWQNSITGGAVALQDNAIEAAKAYLIGSWFYDDLESVVPTSLYDATAVLTAWAAEMSYPYDEKTLTTKASTGLVAFLDAVAGSSLSWNTEADIYADYPDSTYVVKAVI